MDKLTNSIHLSKRILMLEFNFNAERSKGGKSKQKSSTKE